MHIIKHGKNIDNYHFTCTECECEYTCNENDENFSQTFAPKDFSDDADMIFTPICKCPDCGKINIENNYINKLSAYQRAVLSNETERIKD